MTGPMIFTPDYYERMRQLESLGWWNEAMREVARTLFSLADLPARGAMLDVGCGSGQTIAWFSSLYPGWRHCGLDVASEGLNAAVQAGLPTVSMASATDLPHPDGAFDFVITLDVLQHLPLDGGDVRALREMHRVLKPGGYLFIRTNAQSFPVARDDPEANFHKYDPAELRGKLATTGFRVLRLSRLNAVLGLAEIPRELRAGREHTSDYHGILGTPRAEPGWLRRAKINWLRLEGAAVRAGMRLPLGRTIMALCRTEDQGKGRMR